ncbi:MAG: YggS family pyridoxal phosphate-dependent enzyme [Gammaproteobacteria bacterium]|nr:YggS family pyridoxal phosphate-dependent enzyme [Gammaproteobacteria bacterium]
MSIKQSLTQVQQRIDDAKRRYGRESDHVTLLAVSKTRSAEELQQAVQAGQHCFGENYLQEALDKIEALQQHALEWHFIGPIQSNKTRAIAESFQWVHSVDRLKIAQRLSEQRPPHLPPLNICLQVNVDNETSKSGCSLEALPELVAQVVTLPNLHLRGLMAIPQAQTEFEQQRHSFRRLRVVMRELQQQGYQLDTLSMGMSGDLEAAIAEGATIVRIGTDIFGSRKYSNTSEEK